MGRTYVHTSQQGLEPARPRRSLSDTSRSARLSCCTGSAGTGRTQGHSSPRHWDPRSHDTGRGHRDARDPSAPGGPQKTHHHRARSVFLQKTKRWEGSGHGSAAHGSLGHPLPASPLCPGGQWVQTTSPLPGTWVQGERSGQGHGLQSSKCPMKGLP